MKRVNLTGVQRPKETTESDFIQITSLSSIHDLLSTLICFRKNCLHLYEHLHLYRHKTLIALKAEMCLKIHSVKKRPLIL